jgi:hypothetical protein
MFDAPSYPCPLILEIERPYLVSIASNATFNEVDVVSETCSMPRNLSITLPLSLTNLQKKRAILVNSKQQMSKRYQ